MKSAPFVSPFGVRHGTQVISLGPNDIDRLEHGAIIEVDILAEYVAEIAYDPGGRPRSRAPVDLDAEFFNKKGWQVRPSEFLTSIADVAVLIDVGIDDLRNRIQATGFALSGRHPEAGWPDGGVVTAELPQILSALVGPIQARALLATASYEESLTQWEVSGAAAEWDSTASDAIDGPDEDGG